MKIASYGTDSTATSTPPGTVSARTLRDCPRGAFPPPLLCLENGGTRCTREVEMYQRVNQPSTNLPTILWCCSNMVLLLSSVDTLERRETVGLKAAAACLTLKSTYEYRSDNFLMQSLGSANYVVCQKKASTFCGIKVDLP